MKNSPHIKLFCAGDKKYAYDVNTNEIIELAHAEYEYLSKNILNFDSKGLAEVSKRLESMQRDGYFSCGRPKKIEHELSPYIEDYLKNRLQSITLQVTQNCNFRCRYCSFSGDGSLDRKHNNKNMNIEIARKAIDFFRENSTDLKQVRLAFYGGEPLLESQLIREIVEYAKKIMPEKKILFSMTTNLSCLDDLMCDFLINNDFEVAVSLDGPPKYHNKYRKFAHNGKNTFDVVYKNFLKIRDRNSDYFYKKVSISAVLEGNKDIKEIEKFFNEGIFEKVKVSYSVLDSSKINFKTNPSKEFWETYSTNTFKGLINNYLQNEVSSRIGNNDIMLGSSRSFEDFLKNITKNTKLDIVHHSGGCIPGHAKMIITTEGRLVTCEKASDNSEVMSIGTLDKGYDYKKAYDILNVGQIIEKDCKNCWAIRFCSTCAVMVDNLDAFSKELKLEECEMIKKRTLNLLKNYVILKEFSCNALGGVKNE